MNLQTQKNVFWGSTAAVGAGALIWALSAAFSGSSTQEAKPQPTAAATQPQDLPPVKKGDTIDEKAEKLIRMQTTDKGYLAQHGFNISSYTGAGYCTSNGGLDGSGWHGVSSGLSYGVTKNGLQAQACVSHKGAQPQGYTTNYTESATPAVVPPQVLPQQEHSLKKGDNTSEKGQKLAAMFNVDKALIEGQGYRIKDRLGVGYCKPDGSVDTSGWHGVSSGISYSAVKNEQSVKLCVSHKGGKPVGNVTGSPM